MKKTTGKMGRRYNNEKNASRWTMIWMTFSVALGFVAVACSHAQEPPKPHQGLEIPAVSVNEKVIYNSEGQYSYLYAPNYKLSRWVAYTLTRRDIVRDVEAEDDNWSDSFRIDPQLEQYGWESAKSTDYVKSGYDRGHLVPSADRQHTEKANRATYLYSNVAPQLPKLNRGAWRVMEAHLRTLPTENDDTLYIVVGGVLRDGLPVIGEGKVAVPELFFKAAVMRQGDNYEGVAYVMPNDTEMLEGRKYDSFEVSVDSVERLTGLDLFPLIEGF